MAILGTFTKQPSEVLDYDVDFTDWLPTDDIVETAAVTADAGLTVDSHEVISAGTAVKVWLSGGTAGTTYKVQVTANSNAGRVKEAEFKIRVKEY